MACFPFLIELNEKKCVIAGGGTIAARKVKSMLEFGANVTVIAPEIQEEIKERSEQIRIICREIQEQDLQGADVVILATDQPEINHRLAQYCKENKILVNVVDVKEDCGFYFPAIIKQEDVVVSISTAGESPLLASYIRKEIEENLNTYYGNIAKMLGEIREDVFLRFSSPKIRKEVFQQLISWGIRKQGNYEKKECLEFLEQLENAQH